jgi:3-carboxy-cis,cis-muconate cycloisomerase
LPFDALFVPPDLREAVGEGAWWQGMLDAEAALGAACAHAGVIPAEAARVIASCCVAERFDLDALALEARRVGNPAEPLVRALREEVGEDVAPHVHHGATSQDVMDTAAALVSKRALGLVTQEVDGLAAECARLADEHRGTVMPGRTLLQQAVPTTFGLKAAMWLVGLVEATPGLEARLPAQLGGAAGTLAALGEHGRNVLRAYARELGLDEPPVPWHANRVRVAQLGAGLAVAAGAVAKIALDVLLLAQTEVGEVREPAEGGSSTMPHKRNPVGSTLARACATGAQAAAGILVAGPPHEHERAAGAWQAEWRALSDALALTGGAAAWMRETLAGLEVDAERMRANLREETMSEAQRFFPGTDLAPEDYLGAAETFVDRALGLYRR